MSIYPYQTLEVRDLAWACFSPPLMDTARLAVGRADVENCSFPLTPLRRAWLEKLDRDASPLLTHLSVLHSRRLGVYFESLWHFFLAQDPEVELVAHNLPVTSDGRTLGEVGGDSAMSTWNWQSSSTWAGEMPPTRSASVTGRTGSARNYVTGWT
jgi:hypothetical protein